MALIARPLRSPAGALGLAMLLMMLAATALTPLLSAHDPFAQDFGNALRPPSAAHWFGTDNFGRDIFTRVLAGAVYDLRLALVCVFGPMAVGMLVGLVAGYLGGAVDGVLMRLTDFVWAFPFYVLVLAIVGSLGPSEQPVHRLLRRQLDRLRPHRAGRDVADLAAWTTSTPPGCCALAGCG